MVQKEGHITSVALATLSSRVAGLFRDMVLFALLGLSVWNNAFLFAFTIPNLFRRLLGEGALSSSMIPLFSETLNRQQPEEAFDFLNRILTRLTIVIFFLILVSALLIFSGLPWMNDRWQRALTLTVILSPYLWFACISAMLCGALNVLDSFGLPALTSTWLNFAILVTGSLGLIFFSDSGFWSVVLISIGVLSGGVLQVAFPWIMLRRRGWKFRWDLGSNSLLERLWKLFLPAVLGAAMAQINLTISRLLAFWLTPSGISTLYLSSRIVELPLGVFVIAISSVLFPTFSRCAAAGDWESFSENYQSAQRSMLMITTPATIGLILIGQPILSIFFEWGNFTAQDLQETYPVLLASALGIPFYALMGIAVRAFHSQQDMKTPLKVAVFTIFLNLILTLLLVHPLGASGIALASVLAAATQYGALQWILHRRVLSPKFSLFRNVHALFFGNIAIVSVLLLVNIGIRLTDFSPKMKAFLEVGIDLPVAFFLYIFILLWLKFEEVSLFVCFLKRIFRFGLPCKD